MNNSKIRLLIVGSSGFIGQYLMKLKLQYDSIFTYYSNQFTNGIYFDLKEDNLSSIIVKKKISHVLFLGGIINFSRQLASYYGKFGLRVNTISPGGIIGHVKGSAKTQNKKFLKRYTDLCPLKRLASSTEIASSALFLASDASSYITGTNFVVDGGWSII